MTEVVSLIPRDILIHLTTTEREWLSSVFERFGGRYPTLEEIWQLMDEAWREYGCDPVLMDERVDKFYMHPVWLLNGLFIEQHDLSLENRRLFTDWVVRQAPGRVADYGGGFGSLARMIGIACPDAVVEVIEPHPHAAAIERAAQTRSVRYMPELAGEYDILIATDVFEHVLDPLALAAKVASSLKPGGYFLIANCFHPVILCHLPQTFHLRYSWDAVLAAMGLVPSSTVCYGRAYFRGGDITPERARYVERRSRRVFNLIERFPGRTRRWIARLAFSIL